MRVFKIFLIGLLCFGFVPVSVRAEAPAWMPEEPDYAFFAGSPYTEPTRFLQVILTNYFQNFRAGEYPQRQLSNLLRFEYGLTDRLEADLVLSYNSLWSELPGTSVQPVQQNGFGNTLLGLRYRFLNEESSPLTLTFGPQLLLPTGVVNAVFGNGGLGLAWDLTMAREWSPLLFTYLNLNYATTFNALDPTPGSLQDYTLQNLFWAVALGFRPLEVDGAKGGHHCLHAFLEAAGVLQESVDPGAVVGIRSTQKTFVLSPGLRYGYLTKNKTLAEVGLAAPVGFGQDSPTWGLMLQTQLEYGFVKKQ